MKYFFLLALFFSCVCEAQKNNSKNDLSDPYEDAMAQMYIVIAGASADFHALDNLSKEISKKTGIEYSNDLVYDSRRGMIAPDSSDDEIYAGSYFPRRYDTSRISIEMMWYYSNGSMLNTDTTKMIIVIGIFDSKKSALLQLKSVQDAVPTAYIKKMKMYMGCMH
ncbi:MAG: hypothetical protein WCI97_03405 [Bacteroidota bacterium]